MELTEHSCKRCGGSLVSVGENRWKCQYCGRIYDEEAAVKNTKTMRELFDESKQEVINNLRRNLYDATNAEFISSGDVKNACTELKKYLPDDFAANFYEVACGSNVKRLTQFIRRIDIDANIDEIENIINFLVKSLQTEYLLELNNLVEKAYKNRDLQLYEKYATMVSVEAEKVQMGIYETKLPREVFIAYSSKDMDKVSELCEVLEAQGLQCFVAARNLRHGKGSVENYDKALKEAMDHCKSFVFVSSLNSRSLNCDALEIEIPYVRHADIENSPAEYRNNYISIPHRFKKPRVEYRIQESKGFNAADGITNEFFDGYERVYSPEEVAQRILKQLVEVPQVETPAAEKKSEGKKICVGCGTENDAKTNFCVKCSGKQFVASVSEYIKIKNQQELDESRRREAARAAAAASSATKASVPPKKKKGKGGLIAGIIIAVVVIVIIIAASRGCGSNSEDPYYDMNNGGIHVGIDGNGDYIIQYPSTSDKVEDPNNTEGSESLTDYTDTYANITYTITPDGVMTISGSGDMPEFSEYEVPWRAEINFGTTNGGYTYNFIPPQQQVHTVIIEDGITSVGSYAFSDFWNLKEVRLPASVKRIGQYAFYSNDNLESIDLSNVTDIQNHAFYDCYKLGMVTLCDTIEHVGDSAFLSTTIYDEYMKNGTVVIGNCLLKSSSGYGAEFSIPEGVVCIADMACIDNYDIKELVIPESVKYIGSQAFQNCDYITALNIPSSVVYIGDNAFCAIDNLKSVSVVDGSQLTSLGIGVFDGCDNLKAVNLTKATLLGEISESCFYSCDSLTDVKLSNSLAKVGRSAFQSCGSLTSIIIPVSVTSIGEYAFDACYYLDTILYTGNQEEWALISRDFGWNQSAGMYASNGSTTIVHLNGAYDPDNAEKFTDGLQFSMNSEGTGYIVRSYDGEISDVVIPSTYLGMPVVEIMDDAFNGNETIKSVQIPASVVRIGSNAFRNAENLVTVTFAEGSALTEISSCAFQSCQKLERIKIPRGIASLSSGAFVYCSALATVEFEEGSALNYIGSEAFRECGALKSINIPSTVTEIGSSAFYYAGLESIYFGEDSQLTTLGESAFASCSSLKSITLPASLTAINSWTFNGSDAIEYASVAAGHLGYINKGSLKTLVISSGESIPSNIMSGCSNLESLTIGDSVKVIGSGAFSGCDNLTEIIFGANVEEIGSSAFSECSGLQSIVIPDTVKVLGTYAFSSCEILSTVTMGSGVTEIPQSCFAGCEALRTLEIPQTVVTIGESAFNGSGIQTLIIPESVTKIGNYAFSQCEDLEYIVIPNGITSLENDTFWNTKLRSVSFPIAVAGMIPKNNLEHIRITDGDTIPAYAFDGCAKLQSVELPNTEGLIIGAYAFRGCRSLTSITLPVTLDDIAMNAFENCHALAEVINHTSQTLTVGDNETFGGVAGNALIVHSGESLLDTTTDGYVFITVEDVHHLIGYIGNATELVFPESYDGDVYRVRDRLFHDNDKIVSVTISGVEAISEGMFYECSYLKTVTIGSGVKSISDNAFYYCDALETVTVGDDVTSIGYRAFENCYSLKALTLGQSLESIGSRAFYYCVNSLERVVIPTSVTYIGNEAFGSCSHLSGVRFEDSGAQWGLYSSSGSGDTASEILSVSSTVTNADNLRENKTYYIWKKIVE